MAAVTQLYDHTVRRFTSGELHYAQHTFKVMLLGFIIPDLSHTTLLQVKQGYNPVYAPGYWPLNGVVLTNFNIVPSGTSGAKLIADNINMLMSEGMSGVYTHIVIYDDSDGFDAPLLVVSLNKEVTVPPGERVIINWDEQGIVAFAMR